jgi:cell division protein FtsX
MITEEISRPPMHAHKSKTSNPLSFIKQLSGKSVGRRVVSEVFVGIVISIISFLLASLVFFNDQLAVAQKKYLQDFHWLVLVRGDQLGVDEVGRFLRQFDGVERAEYMSSDTLLGRVAKEGVSDEDLNFIKAGSLPSAWEVKWTEEADMRKMLTESLVDIKNFPGVVDVLYSGDTLRNIQTGR